MAIAQGEQPADLFQWRADWGRPSTGVRFVAIMIAISLFMMAVQTVLYASGSLVASLLETFDAAKLLQRKDVTFVLIALPTLFTAVAIVVAAYRLFGVIRSRRLLLGEFWDELDLEGDDEGEEGDLETIKYHSEWVFIALFVHVVLATLLLFVLWNKIILSVFSVDMVWLGHGASFDLDSIFSPVSLTFVVMVALSPFVLGVFWIGLAIKRAELPRESRHPWVVQAVPFLLCYLAMTPLLLFMA